VEITRVRKVRAVAVPSAGRGKGHFLQPTWGKGPWGNGSLADRLDAVKPFFRGDSLLDVGCASRYGHPDWLHGLIAKDTSDLVGIDINKAAVKKMNADGYDVRLADARDFDLGRKFDTVFAGEIIEHLDDIRGFLTSVKRHLNPGGRLVLTTPNPFYVGSFVYRFGGHVQVHPQHTCWFCEDTLRRVLSVDGFPTVEVLFTGHPSLTPARRLASLGAKRLLPPRLALDTLIAVASPN
jgi:2-polyprenyl-3-methyl-5-hydroxy-6-metoxy-1,4-benzoquinol methylase